MNNQILNNSESNQVVNNNNLYMRFNNNQLLLLKENIQKLYNIDNIIITNSGLNANSIILEIFKIYYNNKINIIFSKELYFENINLIKYFSKINNIIFYNFDFYFDNNLKDFILKIDSDNIIILFIESCTNPFGYIFNYDIINELKTIFSKLYIICDNTWLSNKIFNPFNYNIDIVTISLTKYYSGGAGICGACIIRDKNIYNCANEYLKIYGIHNSPKHLEIINNLLNTYDYRIKKLSNLTKYIINHLLENNIDIIHPYLNNHPSYNLAIKFLNLNLYPSTFLIKTKFNNDELLNIINSSPGGGGGNGENNMIIPTSVSFGSNITKIDKNIFQDNCIRLSIGYDETYDSLKEKINELIKLLVYEKIQ